MGYLDKVRFRFLLLFSVFLHIMVLEFLYSPGPALARAGGSEMQTMQVEISNGDSPLGKNKDKFAAEFHKKSQGSEEGENIKRLRTENKEKKSQGSGKGNGAQKNGSGFQDLYKLDKKWSDLVDRLEKNTNIASNKKERFDSITNKQNVSESYIYRKRHYEDIIVKDVFPTLENINKPFSELVKEAPDELNRYVKRNQIIEDYRRWNRGELKTTINRVQLKDNQKEALGPLHFKKEKRKDYFERTVKKSKEEQLDEFIADFMPHDANKGDLPVTLRELFFVNLLRVVYKFSSDPNYFVLDYFEENLNKEDYLKRAFYHLSRLKDTKTGTEILFTLENIYSTQERAWIEYFNFKQRYKYLKVEKKDLLHVEVLKRVVERYEPLLKENKVKDIRDIHKKYLKKRLEITDYILSHSPSGYRQQDALYKKGRVLWEMGEYLNDEKYFLQAIRQWGSIREPARGDKAEEFTYLDTYRQLKHSLNNFSVNKNDLVLRRHLVSQILGNESTELIAQKQEREKRLLYP